MKPNVEYQRFCTRSKTTASLSPPAGRRQHRSPVDRPSRQLSASGRGSRLLRCGESQPKSSKMALTSQGTKKKVCYYYDGECPCALAPSSGRAFIPNHALCTNAAVYLAARPPSALAKASLASARSERRASSPERVARSARSRNGRFCSSNVPNVLRAAFSSCPRPLHLSS